MKKKVLFIVPQLIHGGSNKSLECILDVINQSDREIRIISLGVKVPREPYRRVFAEYLIPLSRVFNSCVQITLVRKFLNALQNYLHLNPWSHIFERESRLLQKKWNFDIVVGFEESYATYFASLFDAAKKIAWVHCDYDDYLIRSNHKDEEKTYSRFNKIICVSEYTRKTFLKAYPALESRTDYLYNLLDEKTINNKAKESINDTRFDASVYSIISIGRFVEVKQFHLIPEIVRKMCMANSNLPFVWYIIGGGDKSLMEITERKINEYNLNGRIRLLGQIDNPYPYICQSNLLVSTSRSEACPYVVLEAKLLHVPVVLNDFPTAFEMTDAAYGKVSNIEQMPQLLYDLVCDKDGQYTQLKHSSDKIRYDSSAIRLKLEAIL